VSDGERGICKDAEEKYDEVYFGSADVEVHRVYVWSILVERSTYGGLSPYCICHKKMTFMYYEKGPPKENEVFGCKLPDWNHPMLSPRCN
jgi:hypothetical protein